MSEKRVYGFAISVLVEAGDKKEANSLAHEFTKTVQGFPDSHDATCSPALPWNPLTEKDDDA